MKKVIKSLRFRLAVALFVTGMVPALLVGRSISAGNLEKHINNRIQELQYQCNTLVTQISKTGYLSNSEENLVFNGQLELLAGIYDGRIILIDKNFKIIEDTYRMDEGRLDISEVVLNCFLGDYGVEYNEELKYAQFALPIYDSSGTGAVQGVMLVSTSTEKLTELERSFSNRSSLLEVALVVLLGAASVVISGFLLKPVKKLKEQIGNAADGSEDTVDGRGCLETEQISESYNRTLNRLQMLDQSRQEFVSNVSHELKTPITSIRVLADSLMAQPEAPTELYREFLGDISDEIDRESTIIDDLLTLVKLDKTGVSLNVMAVNINDMLEYLLKRLRPLANRRGIEMTLECVRPVTAEVDEVKLNLAISNLVENAIKYNKQNGWVKVTLNADHKFFYIVVSDSGVGIPEDAREHVFERFYRVDKARSRDTGGTGLGLAITENIVKLHQGAIRLSSVEGEGTTFTVRIPLHYIQ